MSEDHMFLPDEGLAYSTNTIEVAENTDTSINPALDVEGASAHYPALQQSFWADQQESTHHTPVLFIYSIQKGKKKLDGEGLERTLRFSEKFLDAASLCAVPSSQQQEMDVPLGLSAELFIGVQKDSPRFLTMYIARGLYDRFVKVREVVRPRYYLATECLADPIFGTNYGQTRLRRDCNGDFKQFAELIGDVHRAWMKKEE